MYKLENDLRDFEMSLSMVTGIPFISVIGGIGKVILGLTQTISALAIVLIAGVAAIFGSGKGNTYCLRASKHIFHGMGNILAGIIESIPLVGLASAYIRYTSLSSADPPGPGETNYMAYGELYKPESEFNKVTYNLGWYHTMPLPLIKV